MSDFSPDWLALREDLDRRSRAPNLLRRLHGRFGSADRTAVCDLGAGSGALLRALAPYLAERQEWTLLDRSAENLDAARQALTHWAGRAVETDAGLALVREGRRFQVCLRRCDLSTDLNAVSAEADLVAATALFDLAAPAWIAALVALLAGRRQTLYAALTYRGGLLAEPEHPLDGAVAAAFEVHQRSDKGLGGIAAGPEAQQLLSRMLRAAGAAVEEADSTRHVTRSEAALLKRELEGHAGAAAETGLLPPSAVSAWLQTRLAGTRRLSIGHGDLLASWPKAAQVAAQVEAA
ncbi:MAG: class I SAM-dependent methyltransferase [Rhodospirillales bacterium]|nr:class I SAM-dependent methyltransferase [Rhodospirillales bacterium]